MGRNLFLTLIFGGLMVIVGGLADVPTTAAQPDSCSEEVEAVLEIVTTTCEATGRNQACYGHFAVDVTPQPNASDFNFASVGDVADLFAVQSMQLSGMNLIENTWGVALLRVQANLPDTLPGQNVTLLAFGDVSLSDASDAHQQQSVTIREGVNVRLLPSADAPLIGSLGAGTTATATGRMQNSAAEDWVQVRYDGHQGRTGWVIASVVDGTWGDLPEIAANTPARGPMQAIRFSTGIGQPTCADVPSDGLLVQTPKGAGLVSLTVNGVDVQLGSTAFLQTTDSGALDISLIEGQSLVTANGVTQALQPGTSTSVQLDANGDPSGTPLFPQPYDADTIIRLAPIVRDLPEPIAEIPPPRRIDLPTATPAVRATEITRTPERTADRSPDDPVRTEPAPTPEPNLPCPIDYSQTATFDLYNRFDPVDASTNLTNKIKLISLDENCREDGTVFYIDPGFEVQGVTTFVGQVWVAINYDTGAELGRHMADAPGRYTYSYP